MSIKSLLSPNLKKGMQDAVYAELYQSNRDCADLPKIDSVTDKVTDIGDALEIGYNTELDVYNQYKDFYEKAQDEDVSVAQYILQFIEIQRKAVGHYGDLLAKYKIAEQTKEILEFDEHISDL